MRELAKALAEGDSKKSEFYRKAANEDRELLTIFAPSASVELADEDPVEPGDGEDEDGE